MHLGLLARLLVASAKQICRFVVFAVGSLLAVAYECMMSGYLGRGTSVVIGAMTQLRFGCRNIDATARHHLLHGEEHDKAPKHPAFCNCPLRPCPFRALMVVLTKATVPIHGTPPALLFSPQHRLRPEDPQRTDCVHLVSYRALRLRYQSHAGRG